jgi:hypothetical protein
MAWTQLDNGALIQAAERHFDVLVTTDKNLRYQQNLNSRRLAILVLPTTSWPRIQAHQLQIAAAIAHCGPATSLSWTSHNHT